MKKVLILSMTAILSFTSMAFAVQKKGIIEKVNNRVEIKTSKSWNKLKSGVNVFVGDSIRTGLRSTAEIKYDDGTKTRIGSRSNIIINDRKITINKGYIWGKVDKHKTSGLKIITSNAIASIIGTEFFVEVNDEDKTTKIIVLEGEISVSPNDRKKKHQKTTVKAGCCLTIDQAGIVKENVEFNKEEVLQKYDEVVNFIK